MRSLTTGELGKLEVLEQLVCKELYEGIDAGLCYKRIKALLKEVISQYGNFGGGLDVERSRLLGCLILFRIPRIVIRKGVLNLT